MSSLTKKAFSLGGSMAVVRMACSFISIKVTATYLGPAGLALVAQFGNFVSLFQSMLGQGLVTGMVRLASESGADLEKRRRLFSTALRMGIGMVLVLGLVIALASPYIAQWLLTDRKYTFLIAISGIAIAAGILNDILLGSLGVTKEIGLIARVSIASTVLGLLVFAPLSYLWGIEGGLWGTFAAFLIMATAATFGIRRLAAHVSLSDFAGAFDRGECRRILSFYPMLIVNGVLPSLSLILVRDSLSSALGLDSAGLWQATWRVSEVYQAIITSSITLYFMQSMGERAGRPLELRRQILRTLLIATGATAAFAVTIFVFREQVVHIIFSAAFNDVTRLLPLQLLGDVLKMMTWILGMSLVAMVRSTWFISSVIVGAVSFVVLTKIFVQAVGLEGVVWAYVVANALQLPVGLFALRDILFARPVPQPA
jgi:PST family polysaccharide transporter